MKCWVGL